MIRHIVVMRFAPHCTPEQHATMLRMLNDLRDNVAQVRALTVGVHVLSESATPDIGLVADFDSLEDQQAYMRDPYHLKVGAYFGPIKDTAAQADIDVP